MNHASSFLTCLFVLGLAAGPLTATAADAGGIDSASVDTVDATGAAIPVRWPLQALSQFMAAMLPMNCSNPPTRSGCPSPWCW